MIGDHPRRIGEILRDAGQLDSAQLEAVLARQKQTGERFCSSCLGLGLLAESSLVEHLGKQKGVPGVELERSGITFDALRMIPVEVARKQRMLPLAVEGRHLLMALADPDDMRSMGEVEFVSGKRVIPHVALAGRIDAVVAESYALLASGPDAGCWYGAAADRSALGDGAGRLVVRGAAEAPDERADELGGLVTEDDALEAAWLGAADAAGTAGLGAALDQATGETGPQAAPGGADVRTVLVVDDDPDILAMVVRYLESHGYRTAQAEGGRDALKKIRASKPDLIVLDAMLPEIHGFEICQKVKNSKRFGSTPVIMISAMYKGWRYREDVQRTYGADDYLEKPFSLERLEARVRRLLECERSAGEEQALLQESRDALEEGLEAQRQGNLDAAIARFREGIEVDPLSPRLHFHLANLLAARQDLYEAIHSLEKTIELEPDFFPALKGLAILYHKKGFSRKSVEMWERALYAAPDVETRQKIRSHLFHIL